MIKFRMHHFACMALLAITACSDATEPTPVDAERIVAGWYLQRNGQHLFQACGQETPKIIAASDDLIAKARGFDMQDDMPVYVKIVLGSGGGTSTDKVARVEQFGADTPVKNCAMNGVVILAPEDEKR